MKFRLKLGNFSPQDVSDEKHEDEKAKSRVSSNWINIAVELLRRYVAPLAGQELRHEGLTRPEFSEEAEGAQNQRYFEPLFHAANLQSRQFLR